MTLGPFLRREMISSVRGGRAFPERVGPAIVTAGLLAVAVGAWDWQGWDRSSPAGHRSFALTLFAVLVAAQVSFELALIPSTVAPAIASERDRKTLDSLLTTRLAAADFVLGAIAAGLLRLLNGLAGVIPLVILLACSGGVDARLVLLAMAGLASTALALAAIAAAVSTVARTASRAVALAVVLSLTWIWLPTFLVFFVPRVWPAAAAWVAPIAVPALDASPLGPAMSFVGAIPRGSLVETTGRMIGYQVVAGTLLILWACARLRPASRALHDVENRAAILRILRDRWRRRPPCGDDPVLWHEIHPGRSASDVRVAFGRVVRLGLIGLLAWVASWFAVPAFAELFRSGYGLSPEPSVSGEWNPVIRVLLGKLLRLPFGITPGQARPEFNVVLRMATGCFSAVYVLVLAGYAAECLAIERERETWLGLIATPLTGREILRGKTLGAIAKARGLALAMLALWSVGLLAGAVHPIGFVASLAGLAASTWLMAAWGVSASLRSADRHRATSRCLLPLLILNGLGVIPFCVDDPAGVLLGSGSIPFQAWASLLSYEDLRDLSRPGPPGPFAAVGSPNRAGIGPLLAIWAIGTIAQAIAAMALTRSSSRGFDAAIGRPTRPGA